MKTFEELGVCEEIRHAIEELGFVQPMPVQEEVIPYLLGNQNDVIALAQTGTGKTAAFGIPVLQRIDTSRKETQALILSPTRELCLQIADDLFYGTNEAPLFRLVMWNDTTTDLMPLPVETPETASDDYYTLSGMKLKGRPNERGIYIYKGKKITIR